MRWLAALALVASPAMAQDVTQSTIGLINIAPTGTPLNLGDDATAQVQLGFTFDYFGQQFTQAWVSSNGFLSFSTSDNLCCNGWPIESAPRNSIFANWSDLVSWSNPYVQTLSGDTGSIFVAGWYGTQEYGSGRSNTFEIQLYEGGSVNLAYGNVANIYHTVTAGLTGPTATDNLGIFYGQNIGTLSGASYAWAFAPAPQAIDCSKTPLDPSCPPITVAYSPVSITPIQTSEPEEQATETVENEPMAAAEAEQIVAEVEQAVAEIEQAQEPAQVEATVAAAEKTEAKQAERLSPAQLAALVANRGPLTSLLLIPGASLDVASTSQIDAQADGYSAQQTKQETQTAQESDAGQGFTFASSQGTEQLGGEIRALTNADPANPASQMQLLEILNSMPAQEQREDRPAETDKDMLQLAGGMTLAAYAQARIPDAVFYNEREIYRRNRPVDAYMLMYRLMMTNDRTWSAMVDAQYER